MLVPQFEREIEEQSKAEAEKTVEGRESMEELAERESQVRDLIECAPLRFTVSIQPENQSIKVWVRPAGAGFQTAFTRIQIWTD